MSEDSSNLYIPGFHLDSQGNSPNPHVEPLMWVPAAPRTSTIIHSLLSAMTGSAECGRVDRACGRGTGGLFAPSKLAPCLCGLGQTPTPRSPRDLLRPHSFTCTQQS